MHSHPVLPSALLPCPPPPASHSTVPFPVDAYLKRIDGVAQHVRANLGATGLLAQGADPALVLQVVERSIFAEPWQREEPLQGSGSRVVSLGYRAPPYGRTALPPRYGEGLVAAEGWQGAAGSMLTGGRNVAAH